MAVESKPGVRSDAAIHHCIMIPFPMVNRIGKIRDVAAKLLDKPTGKSAEYYRAQVNAGLSSQFEKIGLSPVEAEAEIAAFWDEVEREVRRSSETGAA